jgi:hypothetical protein
VLTVVTPYPLRLRPFSDCGPGRAGQLSAARLRALSLPTSFLRRRENNGLGNSSWKRESDAAGRRLSPAVGFDSAEIDRIGGRSTLPADAVPRPKDRPGPAGRWTLVSLVRPLTFRSGAGPRRCPVLRR